MRFFGFIIAVFRNYSFGDKLISVFSLAVIILMFVKMMVFPYGFFNFGQPNIYTEALVSKNGIQNINPLFVDYNEVDREVSRLVFSGLMKYDPDKKAIVDDMATLAINDDKTEYTFTLRDGLQWHDGEPVTAEDVYFTFHDMVLDPAFPNQILKTNFAGIDVELIDEKSVKFILSQPNIFFVTNLTVGILPKHVLEDVEPHELLQADFNKKPIGTGPYMVDEGLELFPDGRMQVTLARNPYYYDEVSEIETMRFLIYQTMDQLIGDLNAVNGVPKVVGKYILNFENNERFELIPYELPQYTAVFMNMESAILGDKPLVRLALRKAVDKNALIELLGDKIAVDTPLMELNQDDWQYQPNKTEAMGALKDAGYSYAEDDVDFAGIRYDEEGNALELNLIARLYDEDTDQYEETTKLVSFLQDSWEEVGFDIKVEFLPVDLFKERVASRGYDLLLVGQNLGYNLDTYSYWHSTQADPHGQNFSNYKSFAVDTLIENIRSVFDPELRADYLTELAEKIKTDVPAVFLYRPIYYYATDSKVEGINMDGVVFPSDRFARISKWTFSLYN